MLQLEDLRVQAGEFTLDADLRIDAPGRVAVIGPSGSGKSTLLDVIAGFRAPVRGRVLWNGQDITGAAPSARPVAMLFQDNNLFPHLTLEQNLALALRPDGGRPDAAMTRRIADALDEVGLDGMQARRPADLSGGQQSRAALARVLLQDRPVLALDEPFAALGPALRIEMLDLVTDVAGRLGALVLLVSHAPEDARRFAEQVILVGDGKALPPRATGPLFADPPPALRAYLGESGPGQGGQS